MKHNLIPSAEAQEVIARELNIQELVAQKRLLYLSGAEVAELGVFDFAVNRSLLKETFLAFRRGGGITPKSEYLKYPGRPQYDRIITLLGHLAELSVSGVKVIGSTVSNDNSDFPRASAVLVLNDPKTQRPFCIMEGAQISAARTAAVSALAIEYLRPAEVSVAAFIGCGELCRTHLLMWSQLYRELGAELHLFDLDRKKAETLAEYCRELGLPSVVADSLEDAIRHAAIVIPATTAEEPYFRSEWLSERSLYCAVSLLDPLLEVVEDSDAIVVDDLPSCLAEGRPLQRLAEEGRLKLNKIRSLAEVLEERSRLDDLMLGPTSRIFFNPMGSVLTDLALGVRLFSSARAAGAGTLLPL